MGFVTGERLYETHIEVVEEFLGEPQKMWHELTFAEQDDWNRSADGLNDITNREDKEDA
jgi:hypothetical protein